MAESIGDERLNGDDMERGVRAAGAVTAVRGGEDCRRIKGFFDPDTCELEMSISDSGRLSYVRFKGI
jgi:hypothetical protein